MSTEHLNAKKRSSAGVLEYAQLGSGAKAQLTTLTEEEVLASRLRRTPDEKRST